MNYSITKLLMISLFFLSSIQLFAQQSTTGEHKPKDLDEGIVLAKKSQKLIENVPIYIWHRGCGPTSVGMIVGYYDQFGFPDLIDGDAIEQTDAVNEAIASEGHYNDYSLPKDFYPDLLEDNSENSGAIVHSSNCIADFMETSWSKRGNYWGWSWGSDIVKSFISYVNFRNPKYMVNGNSVSYSPSVWEFLKVQIDENRPVILLVDSNGDGSTDHFVPAIGYDDSNKTFAILNTWDHVIHWYEWREMSSSYTWGVKSLYFMFIKFNIDANPDDESKGEVKGSGGYDFQEEVTLEATPKSGYEFTGWQVEESIVSTESSYTFNATENLEITALFSKTTSVEESTFDKSLKVYPNPVVDKLVIEFVENNENVNYEIRNAIGMLICSGNFKNQIEISTDDFETGLYFIQIESNNEQCIRKFVKK